MKTAAQNIVPPFESDIAARIAAMDWPQFVHAADKALYAAKAAGRNRCALAARSLSLVA